MASSPPRRNNYNKALGPGEHRIEHVNTLALPKNRAPKCELSGLMATIALVTKDFTLVSQCYGRSYAIHHTCNLIHAFITAPISMQYYATREHAENAWDGIIYKIAPILGPLRSSPDIVDVDRAKRKHAIEVS